MNNKQPKPQEPKQQMSKQEPVKQPQMPKQNNPVLKQIQPKITQPKTSVFKPDKKVEKYANSNQFRVDHAHDFDNDYEQEFGMSAPEKKLMSNKVIRDAVVDSNVKGNNTGIKNLLNNDFDETDYKDLLNLLNDGKSNEYESINAHEYVPKGNEKLYLFPNDPAMGDFRNDVKKYGLEYAGRNKFNDEDNLVVRGSEDNLRKYADSLGYKLHPDYLYNEREFAGDIYDDFDENNEEDLSVDDNSNNNSGEVGDLGHTLDELEDSGIFNVKMVDEEGNIVFDGNSMDAPLWDENGNEYAIDKIDKDELNRSGIIHLKSGSNNKSLELKRQQLEELVPEDKKEQIKLLLDYYTNDLGIDEETALDSIIESAKKVKKL